MAHSFTHLNCGQFRGSPSIYSNTQTRERWDSFPSTVQHTHCILTLHGSTCMSHDRSSNENQDMCIFYNRQMLQRWRPALSDCSRYFGWTPHRWFSAIIWLWPNQMWGFLSSLPLAVLDLRWYHLGSCHPFPSLEPMHMTSPPWRASIKTWQPSLVPEYTL